MNVILYIDNLATSITEEELKSLFSQIGESIALRINTDRINGEPKDYRFPTARALDQIDREAAKHTAYSFGSSTLRVRLIIPKEQRGVPSQSFEP